MATGMAFKEVPVAGSVPAMAAIAFLTGVLGSGTCLLDHFQCLTEGVTAQLGMEAKAFPECIITGGMEWSLVPNRMPPGDINTELDRLGINSHGVIKNRGSIVQFDFGSHHHFHNSSGIVVKLFKEGETLVQVKPPSIPPTTEAVGFLEAIL